MIEKSLKSESNRPLSESRDSQLGTKATGEAKNSARAESRSETSAVLHEVEIAGVPLRLKSSHDEQMVNELVDLVDRKIREALPLTKTGSIQNAAILASLHLAEEYLLLKLKAKAELDTLEAKTQKIISELESSRVPTGLSN